MGSNIQGTCYSVKKKAPARNAPGARRMGFHQIQGFGSKDLSNPKDDETKNDAMLCVYPLECPKLIIPLKQDWKFNDICPIRPQIPNPKRRTNLPNILFQKVKIQFQRVAQIDAMIR